MTWEFCELVVSNLLSKIPVKNECGDFFLILMSKFRFGQELNNVDDITNKLKLIVMQHTSVAEFSQSTEALRLVKFSYE